MEIVCWLCHTCRLKPPAGPISHATSCNLYVYNLHSTITYTTFIKILSGKDWLLTGALSFLSLWLLTSLVTTWQKDFGTKSRTLTNACVGLLDMLRITLTLPTISSPVSIFQWCLNFTGNSLSRRWGAIITICLTHIWECVLYSTQLQTLTQTQEEEEKEKEKEVVTMFSSSAVF